MSYSGRHDKWIWKMPCQFRLFLLKWATEPNKTSITGVDTWLWHPSGNIVLLVEKTGQVIDERDEEVGYAKPVEAAQAHCEKEATASCEVEKATLSQIEKVECERKMTGTCNANATATAEVLKARCAQQKAGCDKIAETANSLEAIKAQFEDENVTLGQTKRAECEKGMAEKCELRLLRQSQH
ncbi:hypothetical protein ABOM_002117 [Aspergillus bombycis]|uniref:Uncharacterized protein n=1 Tax=Aspergillus bombycis TaxID=109264 RepID=A0A1F8A956_9EURO|nr:hypothetical protein ABOM_002117 [Aspergillus bombycis]OGM48264.1 hypothetical protein ABOM_002117 [Aspergillus bombycis]